jgi:putative flippase GtrA
MRPEEKKDLLFSLICGFLSSIFFLFIIFNPKIEEFEKIYFLKKISPLSLFLFPLIFLLGIKIASIFRLFSLSIFQFAKFVEVGILNTLIDIGTLNFLSLITGIVKGLEIIPLNIISFLLAVVNSYFFNKIWTFEISSKAVQGEFITFLLISLTGLFINSTIVFLGTTFIHYFQISAGALMNLVKIFATLIAMLWNFFGYKIFVFRK